MFQKILDNLNRRDRIVFGPFVGELGWEIYRWCGFVRWYIKNNPKKDIVVSTRPGRIEFYTGLGAKIHTFAIEGEYSKYRPNMYTIDWYPATEYHNIIQDIKKKYPKHYIMESRPLQKVKNVFTIFPPSRTDFNFTPNKANKEIIRMIKEANPNKKLITVASRWRADLTRANWRKEYWTQLFDILDKSGKYYVITTGVSPSYVKPDVNYKHFFDVEDFLNTGKKEETSIGLTIEAIKQSDLMVGSVTSIPIIAKLVKTPLLMWGLDGTRHAKRENPFNSKVEFIEDPRYETKPEVIYQRIEVLTGHNKV